MLAQALDLPPETLQQTIENHNRHAEAGVDTDFGKGSTGYNRYLGDMEHGPNPCLAPIVRAPFYAIRIYPGDIGTSLGLRTDTEGRVRSEEHTSELQSLMRNSYAAFCVKRDIEIQPQHERVRQ